jgi:8-oxo-dGTP diphosphatase
MRQIARAIVIRGEQILVIKRNKYGKEYFTLPGGGVERGESPDVAAIREAKEEASIICTVDREVYHEESEAFGETWYFLCNYVSGEPALDPESPEAEEQKLGQNFWTPMWLEIRALPDVVLYPRQIANRLENDLDNGFSYTVTKLVTEGEDK